MLWYSLEVPRRGTSNEYPQHMFSSRNKKNIMWIPPLICSYVLCFFLTKVLIFLNYFSMKIYVVVASVAHLYVHLTGDQVAGLIPARSGNILWWRWIMKFF